MAVKFNFTLFKTLSYNLALISLPFDIGKQNWVRPPFREKILSQLQGSSSVIFRYCFNSTEDYPTSDLLIMYSL
jgi:hypothetical protein